MNDRHQKIIEIVKEELSYAAHDFDHVMRVYNISLTLAENEQNVDFEVLIPAVLLHDIARSKEDQDCSGNIDHAVLGSEMAEPILKELGYEPNQIDQIKHCILTHRYRSGFLPKTIEAKLLFDADKLDVIGAVGIARSFMLAGKHGERLFINNNLDDYISENIGVNGRVKDIAKHSANIEFELKLKKIPDKLFTKKAKEISKYRIEYMTAFFEILKSEINGIK